VIIPEVLIKLKKILPDNSFLVGGFLRDYLLKKKNFDIDIIVGKDEKRAVEKVAKVFKTTYFPLDEERGIWRIIYKKFFIDIAKISEDSLLEDLKRRDFTVNSLCINIKSIKKYIEKEKIVDYFNGKKDIEKKIIRMIDEKNIKDDPLRILRAFRISSQINFKIEKKTLSCILKYRKLLKTISGERIRDELWKILENDNSHIYINELFKNKILEEIFPDFKLYYDDPNHYFHKDGLWGHSYYALKSAEEILNDLKKYFPRVKRKLENYLESYIDGRTRRKIILKLGVLLHDIGKPVTAKRINNRLRFFGHEAKGVKITKNILNRLKGSKKEFSTLKTIILNHMRVSNLFENKTITKKAIFRFFRDTGDDVVNLLLLSLADRLSYKVVKEQKKVLEKHYLLTKKLIYRFFLSKNKVNPEPLLNGFEIMKLLNLTPSKKVGELKNKIIEMQALGKIRTKKQAIAFLKKCSV